MQPSRGVTSRLIKMMLPRSILDEDGTYDPRHFNDRLWLGSKGTMSEAELHVIRARLQGGILNKTRRGELQCPLPVGLVYNSEGRPILDADKQVQTAFRFDFDAFRRTVQPVLSSKPSRARASVSATAVRKGRTKGR